MEAVKIKMTVNLLPTILREVLIHINIWGLKNILINNGSYFSLPVEFSLPWDNCVNMIYISFGLPSLKCTTLYNSQDHHIISKLQITWVFISACSTWFKFFIIHICIKCNSFYIDFIPLVWRPLENLCKTSKNHIKGKNFKNTALL